MDAPELSLWDWLRNIENIEEWIRGCLGVSKILLPILSDPNS